MSDQHNEQTNTPTGAPARGTVIDLDAEPASPSAPGAEPTPVGRRPGEDARTTAGPTWSALEHDPDGAPVGVPADGGRAAAAHDPASLTQDLDAGLAELDPLAIRPRTSSVVLCAAFALVFLAIAFGAYWVGVHTPDGQSFEDLAVMNFAAVMPAWMGFGDLRSVVVIGVGLALGAVALVVALARRRWWLVGQLAVYAAIAFAAGKALKPLLPRPMLVHIQSSVNNSAPSGHTMFAAAASLALVCAAPRAWRALASLVAVAFTSVVGLSVVHAQWHRPADVVMAVFIAGACAMAMLACTRTSGMDRAGTRAPSPSVQIGATALITLGVCAFAYAAYLVWQVMPGLRYASSWATAGVCQASAAMVLGSASLVVGMVLMMRQLTAAPLTKLGLIGAPPAPPRA